MRNTIDYRTYAPNEELQKLYKEMAEEETKLRSQK